MAGKGVIHRLSPIKQFRVELAQWLDLGLSKPGKTNSNAGRALSPPPEKPMVPSEISKMRRGERRILAEHLFTLANYIEEPIPTPAGWAPPTANGVPVYGEAGLPIWHESDPAPSSDVLLSSVPDHEFASLPHFATKTVGNSMNRLIPEGGYAIYVPYFQARSALTSGDVVLLKQSVGGRPMHKRLIRQLFLTDKGWEFRAISSNNKVAGERLKLAADLKHLEGTADLLEPVGLVVWQCGPVIYRK